MAQKFRVGQSIFFTDKFGGLFDHVTEGCAYTVLERVGSAWIKIKDNNGVTSTFHQDWFEPLEKTVVLGVAPSIADDLRLKPQARKVLAHFRSGKPLTHLEAQAVYGVWSLSSRVSELKDAGYKVRRELKKDGMGKRYASYSMAA